MQLEVVETELKKTNKLIHYTGQYLANKKFYIAYQKSNLNHNYALKYQAELTLFESAKMFYCLRKEMELFQI